MANEEMAQYLGVFLDEANEQLALLEQSILELEHNSTPELLQEIFRAAHTLKGSSRAMGFASMGELTHAMEDVFDKLRHDELTVTSTIVDALFEALDLLKKLKEEIAASGEAATDTSDLTARLRDVMNGAGGPPAAEAPVAPAEDAPAAAVAPTAPSVAFRHSELTQTAQVAASEAVHSGCSLYAVSVAIASDCVMKSVRALMVLQSMERIGSILATTPDDEAIENEQFEDRFGFVLATTREPADIRKMATSTAEITTVEVEAYDPAAPRPAAARTASTPAKAAARAAAVVEDERHADLGPGARGAGGGDADAKKAGAQQSQTVRVDVARLDNLLNLVGELVIDQTRIAQIANRLEGANASDPLMEALSETAAHFGRITGEMQVEIMKARMLPIDNVFNRFPRMIRDLAQKLGKEIEFIVSGRETELDRSVIEVIGDPLIHLLRNSVDHGIEAPEARTAAGKPIKGNVHLSARHEENYIVIEIQDDGRGMNPEKIKAAAVQKGVINAEAAARMTDKDAINLIFASGFSTAEEVSDISGRGVGMDIVKNNLTRFGALLEVESKVGQGTRFTIKLPLTLAIIRGLLVRVGSGVYAVPLASVVETIHVDPAAIHGINHREVIVQRGKTLPLVRLEDVFYGSFSHAASASASNDETRKSQYMVVVGVAERQVGLVVDALLGEQEIVIKSLGKFIGDVRGVSGATILGDGRIALIADINGLLAIASEEKVGAHAA